MTTSIQLNVTTGELESAVIAPATDTVTGLTKLSVAPAVSGTPVALGANDPVIGKINGVAVTGTPTTGQVPTATSGTAATWQTPTGGSGVFSGARVYNSAAVSLPSGTTVTVPFDSERYDTNGYHDTVTNNTRLTIPTGKGGYYSISATAAIASVAGGTLRIIWFVVNGTTNIAELNGPFQGNDTKLCLTTHWNFADGDYVELKAYQDSGSTVNLLQQASHTPEFMLARLG